MKGVAMGVSANLKVFDLTHEIPAYNIWEAAIACIKLHNIGLPVLYLFLLLTPVWDLQENQLCLKQRVGIIL